MVDCRNCKYSYRIWGDECFESEEKYKLVCLFKEVFIEQKYILEGPCDLYVDVDGYIPRD